MRYLLGMCTLLVLALAGPAKELPTAKPSDVGMSAKKLAEVDSTVEKLIEQKRLAGATVMIVKDGKVVHFEAFGHCDLDKKKPMKKDTIFRIYSMSKAITSAAALILMDEGKLDINAPVSQYLPEFKNLMIYNKNGNVAPKRPMTVRDLFTHTSGLVYGFGADTPSDRAYNKQKVLDRDTTLAQMVTKLSKIPLSFEPGADWRYSISIDVLGRVVEVVSGKPLDEFFRERIFEPLDMKDTGFYVPEKSAARFATNYNSDGKGKLTINDDAATSTYLKNPKLFSGGGGLVSTTRDYMRFLVMVMNGGELDGNRVLSKKAVKLMTTNQVPKKVGWIKFGSNERTGVGFGLGFCVRDELSKWDPDGRLGEYGWGGAASTHYWVSPKDKLAVVTMEQTMPYSFLVEFAIKKLVYDAIE